MLEGLCDYSLVTLGDLSLFIRVGLGLGLSLLAWRCARFTVLPILYPDDPQEYPYWIPVLGHLFSFFRNSNKLLARARVYCGNTREPFAINLAGGRIYVLTKASDVAEAYRNIETLSFNIFVQEMLKTAGSTPACVKTMYKPLLADKAGFPNPHSKPLATLARDMHIQQLYPGEHLDVLGRAFDRFFDDDLHGDTILRNYAYAQAAEDASVVLPLMAWCSDVFCRAGQDAYFGPLLEQIDPEMTEKFLIFDELSYQLQFQYPKWLSLKMQKAKDALVEDLMVYFDTPQGQRRGDAWFVKAMEDEMKALNLSTYDISVLMVTIYWGFLDAAYTLQDRELYRTLVEEIQPAFMNDQKTPDAQFLLKECTLLNAVWDETVRMSAFSASVRHITKDTKIGGKFLRKGSRLMIPYRQMHFDESIFGADAQAFRCDRFLKDKTLKRGSSWRPFGGGTTQCPGRFAAKQVVLSFTATLLKRFDVQIEGQQPFPEGQLGKPVLGIMASTSELRVRISPRET
ncbi:MAG: hypothetical protein LQ349_007621 [Xanthoria aureola]|nr:MAG: hypothetical protein LQ349_007621 [Xanthoria aureola]